MPQQYPKSEDDMVFVGRARRWADAAYLKGLVHGTLLGLTLMAVFALMVWR